jgi:hypothetical protein
MFVVVPDSLHDAIAEVPDAARDRDHLYSQLLSYFNEHGSLPEFSLTAITPEFRVTSEPTDENFI